MKANYLKAVDMFKNLAGEGNALAEYCNTLALDHDDLDEQVRENIKERCADELNHVLGDLADAITLSELKIDNGDIENIFNSLKSAVKD